MILLGDTDDEDAVSGGDFTEDLEDIDKLGDEIDAATKTKVGGA